MPAVPVRQIAIVHLSDVHFGPTHRFDPVRTASGDVPSERDYPTLLEKLQEELGQETLDCPVIVVISGDLAQTGAVDELERAEEFVRGLAESNVLGATPGLSNVILVPGNHDVTFDRPALGHRWQQWVELHNRLRVSNVDRNKPSELDAVEDRVDELGAIFVTLNSAVHVEKDNLKEQIRGRIEDRQIDRMKKRLEEIDPVRREEAIRIAVIHHHPVLIPDLVEPSRNYDAVHNAAKLLTVLRQFGFHVLLHGHKHHPHVFTEDSVSAFRKSESRPILIVAGGSVGSRELPERCGNCYNRIDIKWNPDADQTRIRVTTRGLRTVDDTEVELLPWDWSWYDARVDDRQFLEGKEVPLPRCGTSRAFDAVADAAPESRRGREYRRLNFCFPVAAFRPSLTPDQINDVRLWIVRHPPKGDPVPKLARVTWSAGDRFGVVAVDAKDDPACCITYDYWGPMLVQAHMEFDDGTSEDAHIYVRVPQRS
jgi:3',5'-cyclic AMP phosphodiesterase CpdA